jgi:uncharacterized surface protein with fasciclin (FAS1) repeats
LTIYQLISESKYTSNFTKLVNEYEDIVDLLNSTKANFTLFVPTDSAFAGIPDHGDKKPSKEFVEAVLKYHIGLDTYTAHDILTTQTIPTALDEKMLGDEAQRLRVSLGFTGIKVNFYSRVVAANFVSLFFPNFRHKIHTDHPPRRPRTASSTPSTTSSSLLPS